MTTLTPPARTRASRIDAPTLWTLPQAVALNLRFMRSVTDAVIMAVVKADGYGHGAVTVARAAVAAGASWLGVTDVAEAARLRAAGLAVPILSWLNPSGVDAERAAAERVDIAVGSAEELWRLASDARQPVRVHLHVDTGMARGGSPAHEWAELLRIARDGSDAGKIQIVGLMGHLPCADDADPRANALSLAMMQRARDAVARAGFGSVLVHLAATSGVLTDPATHFGMVRVGAGLVGIDPSATVQLAGAGRFTASLVHSSAVPSNTPIGYGGTYITAQATHLGVVAAGYADGIPRELSPGAGVEIAGRRHRVVGRVSMDQFVVDTGDQFYPRGTAVTIFGPDGGAVPSAQDWARWAGTIPHTIVTGIGPRVQRSVA